MQAAYGQEVWKREREKKRESKQERGVWSGKRKSLALFGTVYVYRYLATSAPKCTNHLALPKPGERERRTEDILFCKNVLKFWYNLLEK